MNSANDKTIESYEIDVQHFVNHATPDVPPAVRTWLLRTVRELPKGSTIFEIGSAFGRDAAFLQRQGYRVICSDAAVSFVDFLCQAGFDGRRFNPITDDFTESYSCVVANAVLLHFSREETRTVVKKIYHTLPDDGIFAFTMQRGDGEEWKTNMEGVPRFFCYWQEPQIARLLKATGFTKVETRQVPNDKWLQIIARK